MFKYIKENKIDSLGVFLPLVTMLIISLQNPLGWWDFFLMLVLLFSVVGRIVSIETSYRISKQRDEVLQLISDLNSGKYNATCKYFNNSVIYSYLVGGKGKKLLCTVHPINTECRNCLDYDSQEEAID